VLSQRLVAMMGGALTVESELGRGSTMHFEVELPVGARRDLSRELLPIRGLRALVVDDVESSRHVLVEMLASWSVEAVEASSGAEAIALLLPSKTAPQRPFDLVLLDWRMSTMGGLEVVRWIRDRVEEKVLREPPVVVMVTAFDREQLLDEAAGLPLQAVLRKPVSASRLLDTLVGLRGPERLKLSTDPMASVLARAAPLRGAHILVVEDIDTNQLVACDLLERLGMRATIARNGEEALVLVEQAAFDAILMDLHMPVLDGFEATRQLRRRPASATMPILAMTAAVLADDQEACRAAGMNGHVPKPIEPSVLVESLLEWVRLPWRTLVASRGSSRRRRSAMVRSFAPASFRRSPESTAATSRSASGTTSSSSSRCSRGSLPAPSQSCAPPGRSSTAVTPSTPPSACTPCAGSSATREPGRPWRSPASWRRRCAPARPRRGCSRRSTRPWQRSQWRCASGWPISTGRRTARLLR